MDREQWNKSRGCASERNRRMDVEEEPCQHENVLAVLVGNGTMWLCNNSVHRVFGETG
jgi:hypothetical protein